MNTVEGFMHFITGLHIQVTGRLVRQEKLRRENQRSGNGDPLLLASRKFAGFMGKPMTESYFGQQFPGRNRGVRTFDAADKERHHDILESSKLRQQVMKLKYKPD